MTKSKNRRTKSGLGRWFAEEWIDVCQLPKIVKCGRDKAKWKDYPYCRPRKRINKSTPKTADELSKAEIKRRCSRKKKNPSKRILPKRKSKSRRKSRRKSKRKSKSRRKSKSKRKSKRKSKSRRKSKSKRKSKRKSKSRRRKSTKYNS